MSYTKYPKGSEWRKWDLHIHTPSSYDYHDKSISNHDFVQNIKEQNISSIAITDHHNINVDRIFEIKEKAGSDFSVFPGIELRSELGGSESVHFIGIFSDSLTKDEVSDIWTKISGRLNITKSDIENVTDDRVFSDFKEASKIIHDLGGVVSVHAGSKTNSIENIKSNLEKFKDAIKEELVTKYIDILEIGKPENIDDYKNIVFPAIGTCLPLILASDNHKATEYRDNRFVWIKADPTFEGLKQIIYEPDGRVKIQQNPPEEKRPYTVIDAVRFVDSRTEKEFSDSWIEINPNLNSIIGGKSSGKSILLYHIAKTIDRSRIEEINKDSKYQTLKYDFEKDDNFDFEVRWADGTVCKLKDKDNPNRQITYIPQLYLNRLAEDQKDELNTLVDKMLVESSDEYKEFRSTIKNNLDGIKTEMFKVIDNYYKTKEMLKEKREELKELGDKKAISENITKIKEKINILRKESSFSKEEEEKYEKLTNEIATLKAKQVEIETLINVLTSTKESYKAFKSNIATLLQQQIDSTINSQFPALSDEISKMVSGIISQTVSQLQKVLESEIQSRFSVINDEQSRFSELSQKTKEKSKELKPLAEKVKNKTVFSQLQKEIESESAKIKLITEKETEIRKHEKSLSTENIEDTYRTLFSAYQRVVEKNKKYRIIPDADNLELNSRIKIDAEKFRENFIQKINKKRSLNQQFGDYFNAENEYLYDQEIHLDNINSMIFKITSGEITYNTGFDEKHAMLSLLDDYFSIDYDLIKDGDDLIKMSPGKRGIILFQLFLHLNKSENPILIDQPEDNLDNRTVYQELNEFIKTKKSTRQIIIVSHNPNLVVSTDSENIIVANQAGQDKSGKNFKFQFEYVNGSIEHSFIDDKQEGILLQRGIRQHICDILEGGEEAFAKRENKYGLKG